MNFTLKKCVSGSTLARLGHLTFESAAASGNHVVSSVGSPGHGDLKNGATTEEVDRTYQTPMCFQYTRNGAIPHLVWELTQHLLDDDLPLLVALPDSIGMREQVTKSGLSLSDYAMMEKKRPVFVTTQDATKAYKGGQNDIRGVAVYSIGGRHQLNCEEYIDIMNNFRPDAFQSLSDSDTPQETSKKRLSHSVTRTLDYLDKCLELKKDHASLKSAGIFASIEGGYDLKSRMASVRASETRPVSGFIIDGFVRGGFDTVLNLEEVTPFLKEITKGLPDDKPRALFGSFNPETIFKLINEGVDIFDTSFATYLAEKGCALRIKVNASSGATTSSILDLNTKQYKEEFDVIDGNCKCYACTRNFTKVYIHHLLDTKEMLASVLLMLHNLYVFCDWFKTIRTVLDSDKLHIK